LDRVSGYKAKYSPTGGLPLNKQFMWGN
jgi:hypothetical protein